jgi:hypothetical protein
MKSWFPSPAPQKKNEKLKNYSQKPVTHTCNPSFLGGRDREGGSSRPAQGNGLHDPISKILNIKKYWWISDRVPAWQV